MKKFLPQFLSLCFLFGGIVDSYSMDPIIVCPADISISCTNDHTDTDVTGVAIATAFGGAAVDVEYTDIIVNLDTDDQGFVRRRWNVVGNSSIFCDQTIRKDCIDVDFVCNENIVASLSNGPSGQGTVKLFADALISGDIGDNVISVSREGIFYDEFIRYDCCDIGDHTFYVKYRNVDENGVIVDEVCTGSISVEDKLSPVILSSQPIYLSIFGQSFVELGIEMLSDYIFDNCQEVTATFSQSVFTVAGEYLVDVTVSDASANTTSATLTVVVSNSAVIACNTNLSVSLDGNGVANITSDMVIEGLGFANGIYTVSLDGVEFSESVTLGCSDQEGPVQVTVREETTGNQCWANIDIEDKISPSLAIPNPVYLTLNVPTEALLTTEMLDPYTSDNCGLVSKELSQGLFTTAGTYNVSYTVADAADNMVTQAFQVIVTDGISALDCNHDFELILEDDGTLTVDYFSIVDEIVYLNEDFKIGISYDYNNDVDDFADNVTLDCSDIGRYARLVVQNEDADNICWGEITVLDKKAPTPYAHSSISVTMDGGNPYVLDPTILDAGSFDNCGGELTLVASPSTFTHPGSYQVKLRVFDESGNSDFALTTVNVLQGNGLPIECIGVATAVTNFIGKVTLHAEDFVINGDDFDAFAMSTEIGGQYSSSITFDCATTTTGSPFTLYVRGEDDGVFSTCQVQLTLVDTTPPVAVVDADVTLFLTNGSATLLPETLDDGSYDQCGPLEYTSSQSEFTIADLGLNYVVLTVTDQSGNTNQGVVEVTVVSADSCSMASVIFPESITITDPDGDVDKLSIENLQDIYGYSYAEVHPVTPEPCDGISYAHDDIVIPTGYGLKMVREFTAIDWFTTEVRTGIQIITLFSEANSAITCAEEVTIAIISDNVEVFPSDVLVGGPFNTTVMTLTITGEDGLVLPSNVLTSVHVGQVLTYEVKDTLSGATCLGNINVVDETNGCPLDFDADVSVPLEEISLVDSEFAAAHYSPELLVADFGFAESDVNVLIDSDCAVAAVTYQDIVFEDGVGLHRIQRTFVLIDWVSYDQSSMQGIWTIEQTITINTNVGNIICDTLPNSAPVGDCASGHTLEDDVEWPSDLMIEDYRIKPEELIAFSGVPEIDSEPIFQNTPDNYTSSYVDVVVTLTSSTLTIGRVWTATHVSYGIDWNYTQTIVIDFSDFENLVTVSTVGGRAMPGVMIGQDVFTDQYGKASATGNFFNPQYDDQNDGNGINILDLLLIQRHILDLEELDNASMLAADVNGDGDVKASDLLELRKAFLEVTDDEDWRFVEHETTNSLPVSAKINFLAIKPGDVDDSALLEGEDMMDPDFDFSISDQLLNNGESYLIPVHLEGDLPLSAIQISLDIDQSMLSIDDVWSELAFEEVDYFINDEGRITLVLYSAFTAVDPALSSDGAVLYIEATAKSNGILHQAISKSDKPSYAVDEELNLMRLGTDVENMIGTGTNSPQLDHVFAYPNPASHHLTIDLGDQDYGDYSISIYNQQGQLLIDQRNAAVVNVQDLSAGHYYYRVDAGEYHKVAKFTVVR